MLKFASGEITQRLPVVYQRRASGEMVRRQAAYRMAADGSVGVNAGQLRPRAGAGDRSQRFSMISGSPAATPRSASPWATMRQGFEYMAGYTYSPDFSLGANGYHPNLRQRRGLLAA